MINPKLHLQAPKNSTEGEFPILLLFSVNGKRLQYYTQLRMPKKFHVKGGKYPFSNKWILAPSVKIKLDNLLRHAYSIESDFIKQGVEQTIDLYRIELDKRYKGRDFQVLKEISLDEQIGEYLNNAKQNLSYNTFKNAQTNLNHLRSFLKLKIFKISASDLTEEIIEEFSEFLKENRMNNTVVKALQILRTFLHYCHKKKHIQKIPLIDTGKANDITVIHLSYDEVMKIAYTPMQSPSLEKVKDFFLFGCFTGMRYGDIAGLKKTNCYDNKIEFFNSKNGTTQSITIPLTEISKNILAKYSKEKSIFAIPSISNQKTNDALKVVAEHSGLDEVIEVARKNGIGRISKVLENKSKLISCHTSRKSFITIAMTLGMKEATIKSITGHSKGSKAFHKYYDVVDKLKHDEMELFDRK